MASYILALDQGTTSSRAIVFDRQGDIVGRGQYPFTQHYPRAGWVEHDPMEIWRTQAQAAADAIAGLPIGSIAGIGVTNQRETTIIWDKATGEPVYNATYFNKGSFDMYGTYVIDHGSYNLTIQNIIK